MYPSLVIEKYDHCVFPMVSLVVFIIASKYKLLDLKLFTASLSYELCFDFLFKKIGCLYLFFNHVTQRLSSVLHTIGRKQKQLMSLLKDLIAIFFYFATILESIFYLFISNNRIKLKIFQTVLFLQGWWSHHFCPI